MWILNFTVHLWSAKCQKHFLYKYQPSSGQSSSLLMKTSCLRLELVELNIFASFTTDDQSIFNVSNTSKSSRWTFSIETPLSWKIFLLQLKFFMDDQHKVQSFQDPQNRSTYIRFGRDSLKFKTHRRNSLPGHTEQRIYEWSKSMNKYSSFPTNKGRVPQHGWQEL